MDTLEPKKPRKKKSKQGPEPEVEPLETVSESPKSFHINVVRIHQTGEGAGMDVESIDIALDRIQGLRPYLDDLYDAFWNTFEDAKDPINDLGSLDTYKARACTAYVEVAHGVRLVERMLENLLKSADPTGPLKGS